MTRRITLLLLLSLFLLLVLCLWLFRDLGLDRAGWVEGKPCAVPCWMHITPGETTPNEARQMLQKGVFGRLRNVTRYGDDWLEAHDLEQNSVILVSGGDPPLIRKIGFRPADSITFQQVLANFGEPTHVVAFAFRSTMVESTAYAFNFIFMSHGLELHWSGNGDGVSPSDVSIESYEFDLVQFFEPSLEAYRNFRVNPAWVDMLRPFDGSYDFDHYCVGDRCSGDLH